MLSRPRGSASFVIAYGRAKEEEEEELGGMQSWLDKGVKRTPASHSLLLSKSAKGRVNKAMWQEKQRERDYKKTSNFAHLN